MMMAQSARRKELEERLAVLKARLCAIEMELDSHQSKDWEDLATERAPDEVLEGLGLSGLQEIRMITAALGRMDRDQFGTCTKCGSAINEVRLDVVPFTPFCGACAV